MLEFNRNHTKELKEYLYNSCIHDAKLKCIKYESESGSLEIQTFNPIFCVEMDFIFNDVKYIVVSMGNNFGNHETIISLTVEEDYSHLKNDVQNHNESIEKYFYILFQTFAGDELHIVANKVTIKEMKEYI